MQGSTEIAARSVGANRFLDLPAPLLGFERSHDGERVPCLFNMSGGGLIGLPHEGETLIASDETDGHAMGPHALRIARL